MLPYRPRIRVVKAAPKTKDPTFTFIDWFRQPLGTTHSPYAGNEDLLLLSQSGLDHEPQDEQRRGCAVSKLHW
jgi:hypothetical protein